jgi:hypothetical protein
MPVDLKKIIKGKIERPPRVLIYGFEGIGKTSFAIGAPDPLVIDANKGSGRFNTQRVFVDTWEEILAWTDAIEKGKVKCGTVIYDTLSDLEQASYSFLFPGTTISKFEGGFNKGDDVAISEWRKFLAQLERIWARGIGITIVSHAKVKTFADPTGPSFDRFELSCRKDLAGLLKGWCDYVLFARENVVVAAEKNKPAKARTTGERWIFTRRVPAYDAKARGTALFPEQLPLSWEEFARGIKNDEARADELRADMDRMLSEIGEKSYEKQVRDWLRAYPAGIVDAHNRVQIKWNELRAVKAEAKSDDNVAAA